MKRCQYCGKEYPDEVRVCVNDGQCVTSVAPRPGMPLRSLISICIFAVLSTFATVGVASTMIAEVANYKNSKAAHGRVNPIVGGPGDDFVAGSMPILYGAGIIGFAAGLIGKTISEKRKLKR